jgi:signal transduction histidine kinase
MKLTKKIQAEIMDVYEAFWGSLFYADIDIYAQVLDDNYRLIGTTGEEIFFSKKEAVSFLKATADQLAGNIEKRKSKIRIELVDHLVLITEQFDAYVLADNNWLFYGKTRVSTWMQQKSNSWKLVQQHFSFPDVKAAEGQTLGLEKITKENIELRQAIKRRTAELENKNRELEIETALEKVRSAAMGMQQPGDMLQICESISLQLQKLGIKEVRNVQTAVFYPQRGTYMNYEFYTRHNKNFITQTSYTNNRIHKAFAVKMQKGKGEFFKTHIKGQKVKEWIAYQKTTNVFIDKYLNTAPSLNYYWHSLGPVALGISTYMPLSAQALQVFDRFRNVFQLSYLRYLDIEKAAAQAMEAKVEAALEKVRSSSLAMHKSEELKLVAMIVFEKLKELGLTFDVSGIQLYEERTKDIVQWVAAPDLLSAPILIKLPYVEKDFKDSIIIQDVWKAKEKRKSFHNNNYSFKEKNKFFKYAGRHNGLSVMPADVRKFQLKAPGYTQSLAAEKYTALWVDSYSGQTITSQEFDTLKRFARVFEQAYVRFLDLQKAEAQAREAQIQLALERVRARTMAMQQSNELKEAANLLFRQVRTLGLPVWSCGYNIWEKDEKFCTGWMSTEDAIQPPFKIPLTESPTFIRFYKSRQNKETFYTEKLEGDELAAHYKYMFSLPGFEKIGKEHIKSGFSLPQSQVHNVVNFTQGNLIFISSESVPKAHNIFIRFAKVFEQTYTRFLDLQKAEAQTREAQIEAALEKVRSSSLAMSSTSQLNSVIFTVYSELKKLDLLLDRSLFVMLQQSLKGMVYWLAGPEGLLSENGFYIPLFKHPFNTFVTDTFKKQQLKQSYLLAGQNKKRWDDYAFQYSELKQLPDFVKESMINYGDVYLSACAGSFGLLIASSSQPLTNMQFEIVFRFTKVFEQAYTRFLDLQKAEAQAKEAQIEAALEKVRSAAMAMHKSEELKDVMSVMFEKLTGLNALLGTVAVMVYNEPAKYIDFWLGTNLQHPTKVLLPFDENQAHQSGEQKDLWESKNKNKALINKQYTAEQIARYYRHVFENNDLQTIPQYVRDYMLNAQTHTVCIFPERNSSLYADSWDGKKYSPEQIEVLKRFAKVFEQAYTRFLDLQKAEAQAREAQIELGLERVRARAMAMQKSEELAELVDTVFKELTKLHFTLDRCIIIIIDEKSASAKYWMANPESLTASSYHLQLKDIPYLIATLNGWKERKIKMVYDLKGDEKSATAEYILSKTELRLLPAKVKEGMKNTDRVFLNSSFNNFGGLQADTIEPLTEENLDILYRFAKVFDLTYTRFNDLKQAEQLAKQAQLDLENLMTEKKKTEEALTDLKAAQSQLIQSEKMASLGELTAGIAHEIQNPLNFVNNFSEVSTELLHEMKEAIEKGDTADAKEIMNEVIQNLEKINHHGRRADSIVKGMLQHSRTSTGQKELTDINALCDEYVRLAYHGLRAKDKTFNATFETRFDEAAGKLNIIPQDIGRVVLNLINNAFYAVNEKKKTAVAGYEPTVSICTKKENNRIVVTLNDNGNGIPKNIVDKIFQPFFTTKPTGQGTGLGLSLSYDIITKGHGGELKVETKEGEGTTFTILLPGNA